MVGRMPRVDELLREEISSHISRDISDPRLGFVTVTAVETAPDLQHAKVYVSMIGSEDQVADSLAALKSAAPYIRTLISRGLRIRRVPALHFAVDATGLRGARIQQLLGSIANGSQPPADLSDLPTPTARDTEHHE
ncbi:MAG: 30S ribosome-binding factor RbfA [Candidatus Limnocylindrus sp.]